ncbi:tetratricopeptide repeat protein [Lentzea sp. NPDC092896]|uniref:tetratricopeptide repeat protein n=1 Tax=Lentzea sp. NPDC092896 TaxID=3364127 RepID=UPI0038146CB2
MHHKTIDNNPDDYPATLIYQWKIDHENEHGTIAAEVFGRGNFPLSAHLVVRRDKIESSVSGILERSGKVILTGLSGSGKTQIALSWLTENSSSYAFRWWVRASDASVMYEDLAVVGAHLGISRGSDESAPDFARRVVLGLNDARSYVIVYDDVADVSVEEYMPTNGGHVIVTTRGGYRIGASRTIPVGGFTAIETYSLISDFIGGTVTSDECEKLAELTSGLALFVAQAASYIAATGMTVSAYVSLLNERKLDLLDRGKVSAHVTVAESIAEAIQGLGNSSRTLLNVFASLADAPVRLIPLIPPNVGVSIDVPSDQLELEDAIAELRSYSLVEREGTLVSAHGLVREVVRSKLSRQELRSSLTSAVLLIVDQMPERTGSTDSRSIMDILFPHALHLGHSLAAEFASSGEISGFFFNRLAPYLQSRGQDAAALQILNRALLLLEGQQGIEAQGLRGSILHNLAWIDLEQGRIDKAIELYRQSISEKVAALGHNSWSLAIGYGAIGSAFQAQESFDEAFEYFNMAVPIFRANDDYYRLAETLVDLAALGIQRGQGPALVAAYAQEAIEVAENDPSAWSFVVAANIHLGEAEKRQGDYLSSVKRARIAQTIAESKGFDSVSMARALSFHGRLLIEYGVHEFGISLVETGIDVLSRVRPTYSLEFARAQGNLGMAFLDCGQADKAYSSLLESFKVIYEIAGASHPLARVAKSLLANFYVAVGWLNMFSSLIAGEGDQVSVDEILGRIGIGGDLACLMTGHEIALGGLVYEIGTLEADRRDERVINLAVDIVAGRV